MLVQRLLDTLPPLLDFGQFVRQTRLLARSHVFGVGGVQLARQMLEQFVQDLQLFLQRFRRAGGKAAVVRFDAGRVKATAITALC